MKVSLALNAFISPYASGGPSRAGYELAVTLQRQGVLGKVFCYGAPPKTDISSSAIVSFCNSKAKLTVLRMLGTVGKQYPALRVRRNIERWMDSWFAARLDHNAGDVLFSPKPLYPQTIARAKELGMQTIVETSVLHPRFNLEVVSEERERLKLNGVAQYTDPIRVKRIEVVLALADAVFARSSFMQQSYIKYGVEPRKIYCGAGTTMPLGVDLSKYYPSQEELKDEFVVLHLSSMSIIKGIPYLLEAWEKVVNKVSGKLVLVGTMDRDMRSIARRYSINNVQWVGPTGSPQNYYRKASVFVSPSISDAAPNTVSESMACGVPVIVSDRCGISEAIKEGQNGFVYHYSDVHRLAELIEWCYQNPKNLREMGKNARSLMEDFSLPNYSTEIFSRIQAITSEKKWADVEN